MSTPENPNYGSPMSWTLSKQMFSSMGDKKAEPINELTQVHDTRDYDYPALFGSINLTRLEPEYLKVARTRLIQLLETMIGRSDDIFKSNPTWHYPEPLSRLKEIRAEEGSFDSVLYRGSSLTPDITCSGQMVIDHEKVGWFADWAYEKNRSIRVFVSEDGESTVVVHFAWTDESFNKRPAVDPDTGLFFASPVLHMLGHSALNFLSQTLRKPSEYHDEEGNLVLTGGTENYAKRFRMIDFLH